MDTTEAKTETFRVRMTPAMLQLIVRAAEAEMMDSSEWARGLLAREARRALKREGITP